MRSAETTAPHLLRCENHTSHEIQQRHSSQHASASPRMPAEPPSPVCSHDDGMDLRTSGGVSTRQVEELAKFLSRARQTQYPMTVPSERNVQRRLRGSIVPARPGFIGRPGWDRVQKTRACRAGRHTVGELLDEPRVGRQFERPERCGFHDVPNAIIAIARRPCPRLQWVARAAWCAGGVRLAARELR